MYEKVKHKAKRINYPNGKNSVAEKKNEPLVQPFRHEWENSRLNYKSFAKMSQFETRTLGSEHAFSLQLSVR